MTAFARIRRALRQQLRFLRQIVFAPRRGGHCRRTA